MNASITCAPFDRGAQHGLSRGVAGAHGRAPCIRLEREQPDGVRRGEAGPSRAAASALHAVCSLTKRPRPRQRNTQPRTRRRARMLSKLGRRSGSASQHSSMSVRRPTCMSGGTTGRKPMSALK